MKTRIFAAIILGGALFTTTACNTVKGLGRDIESVGQAGSNAIN
ncbi:MAG: entericidin A/B family lipoprotein [Novosphingobium sp.]